MPALKSRLLEGSRAGICSDESGWTADSSSRCRDVVKLMAGGNARCSGFARAAGRWGARDGWVGGQFLLKARPRGGQPVLRTRRRQCTSAASCLRKMHWPRTVHWESNIIAATKSEEENIIATRRLVTTAPGPRTGNRAKASNGGRARSPRQLLKFHMIQCPQCHSAL